MDISMEDVLATAADTIQDEGWAKSFIKGTSPLVDAFKRMTESMGGAAGALAAIGLDVASPSIVNEFGFASSITWDGMKKALDMMPKGYGMIEMGYGEYMSEDVARESIRVYNARSRWRENELRTFLQTQQPVSDSFGGYLVPQEYTNKILASFDILKAVKREMTYKINSAIDDQFMNGRPTITAAQARQAVFDRPAEAALDVVKPRPPIVGILPGVPLENGSHAWSTHTGSEFRDSHNRVVAEHSISILDDRNRVTDSFSCENPMIEDDSEFESYINDRWARTQSMYRTKRIMGTVDVSYTTFRRMYPYMNSRSPRRQVSDLQFVIRKDNKKFQFNGSVIQCEEMCKVDVNILGYPVYVSGAGASAGADGEEFPATESFMRLTFKSYGHVRYTIEGRHVWHKDFGRYDR